MRRLELNSLKCLVPETTARVFVSSEGGLCSVGVCKHIGQHQVDTAKQTSPDTLRLKNKPGTFPVQYTHSTQLRSS